MKRLVRKAKDLPIEVKFLNYWVGYMESSELEKVDEIISKHPDCVFSGTGYRYLVVGFDRELNDLEGPILSKEEINNALSSRVKTNGNYQSFAKDLAGIQRYLADTGVPSGIVITSNIRGLDIGNLYNKFKDEYEDDLWEAEQYLNQNEVLAKLNNFEIYGIRSRVLSDEVVTDYEYNTDEKKFI